MGSVIPIINLRNKPIRQLGVFLIQSKLLLAYAALVLTLVIPAQVGLKLVLNPYLVMVFLATYLVYNLTRLVLLQFYKMPLEHSNDQWVNRYPTLFYIAFTTALVVLVLTAFLIHIRYILYLIPLLLIVVLYALPFLKIKNFNLRQIPFLKIALIMSVWACITALFPLLQLNLIWPWWVICLIAGERLALIGALALLFDIRDMQADNTQGLKTIPLHLGESRTLKLSNVFAFVFFICSVVLYGQFKLWYLIPMACLTLLMLVVVINYKPLKKHNKYYDLYLDGILLMHGLLILISCLMVQ
jgi:4-hydroxybenzoate polyprenyltransferase